VRNYARSETAAKEIKTGSVNRVAYAQRAHYNSDGMAGEIIFYQFSRSKVERCDFSHFLSLYAPDKLPTSGRMREMMDRMMFGIEGYDNDAREVHSIPEIRRFYAAFHSAWPYWLYFCNLDSQALRMMVMCCLPSIVAMKVEGKPNVAVEYNPLDLLRFVSNDFGPMNVMCDRAKMSERMIYDRSKAVFEYFNMPFDAEPPP
jgi:hypothetical protein